MNHGIHKAMSLLCTLAERFANIFLKVEDVIRLALRGDLVSLLEIVIVNSCIKFAILVNHLVMLCAHCDVGWLDAQHKRNANKHDLHQGKHQPCLVLLCADERSSIRI